MILCQIYRRPPHEIRLSPVHWVGAYIDTNLESGPDLTMWGTEAPCDEEALKGQNKARDLRQIWK